jgi:hypothetical protein
MKARSRVGVRGVSGTVQATHHCGNVTQSVKTAILEIVPATPLNMRMLACKLRRRERLGQKVRFGIWCPVAADRHPALEESYSTHQLEI